MRRWPKANRAMHEFFAWLLQTAAEIAAGPTIGEIQPGRILQ
jgi:hypothetical protein